MQDFPDVLAEARLWQIVALSLEVSLSAVALAALAGLPLGPRMAVGRFRDRQPLIVLLNALMGCCRPWSSASLSISCSRAPARSARRPALRPAPWSSRRRS